MRRKTPDELLAEIDEEKLKGQGHLKIFLGYTSGVGKSFRMLDEARRRLERGQDVIVGAIQPVMPAEVSHLLSQLEVLPLLKHAGGTAIDLQGILKRRPDVCIIDGLAYDNPPGLRNATRWQDVCELVQAGIKVIGSINIQYIDEMRGQIELITGKRASATVPVSFIKSADEIEIVDTPTEEPLDRLPVQQPDDEDRRKRISMLREMALVLTADVVDHQLSAYLEQHGIRQNFRAQERILVCITPRSNACNMIETAYRIAESFHAEMTVVYVKQSGLSKVDEGALKDRLVLSEAMGAHIEILDGDDPVAAILDYAGARGITQLFIGHTQRSRSLFHRDPVDMLLRRAKGMDIRIFPQ
ncbi:MAG: hypothetical protein QUT30_00325 [Acidobacteriota bacterium]|nr:hypothetical protein [Acidobacteriota bacterium]